MATSGDSRALPLTAVNIAALVLALTVTALRCFVRIRLLKAFGSDDWLMVAAAVCFSFYCAFSLAGVANGTGHHVADLSKEANAEAKKWWYCCYPTYAVTMVLAKMSITFFFRRVMIQREHRWILASAAALTLVSCTIFFFTCIFQCWPVSYFWDKYGQTGTCIPDRVIIALAFLFSVINIITDLTFALLPAWLVSHLHLRLKTKVALCALMGLGCVASAAVVVRLPYLHFIASGDFLFDTVDIAIWSTVEQCVAITAAGLATLQPLIKLIGYKLGFASHPTLPYPSAGTNNIHMATGPIAVKRSFTRKTEARTSAHKNLNFDQTGLKLQPGIGEFSAECYNTSQEFLTLSSEGSDPNRDKQKR